MNTAPTTDDQGEDLMLVSEYGATMNTGMRREIRVYRSPSTGVHYWADLEFPAGCAWDECFELSKESGTKEEAIAAVLEVYTEASQALAAEYIDAAMAIRPAVPRCGVYVWSGQMLAGTEDFVLATSLEDVSPNEWRRISIYYSSKDNRYYWYSDVGNASEVWGHHHLNSAADLDSGDFEAAVCELTMAMSSAVDDGFPLSPGMFASAVSELRLFDQERDV